ncbi:LOW QUALITY PROTEIN: SET domain-containing protein 9-like [Aegotheles albertisi]
MMLGFSITDQSSLVSAGTGVFVTKGFVPKGMVVSMYHNTVYRKHEPIFFQSLGNPFIFRCIDDILIDRNDKGLSRSVCRSCSRRDQLGPFQKSNVSWLTAALQNPLVMGQYVNSCSCGTENVQTDWFASPEGNMPLEDLLAFYGYEPAIPVMSASSADSSPSELADELPDMTLDKEEIAKDLLSGDDEETQSSADDLTPSVTSQEATDFFPRPLRCRKPNFIIVLKKS